MRQPYIYTMPEKFMSDESVPIKWRLYGYINGYWIGGKPVYATNEHFAEKFKCSERHISRALAELESDGLLMRNINGLKRYILPGGMTPEVRGGRRGASAKDDVGGQHISDTISVTKLLPAKAHAGFTISVETEDRERPPKEEKRTKDKLAVFGRFSRRAEPWMIFGHEKKSALVLFDRGLDKLDKGLEIMRDNVDDQYCPQASTPTEYIKKLPSLNRYKTKNGL